MLFVTGVNIRSNPVLPGWTKGPMDIKSCAIFARVDIRSHPVLPGVVLYSCMAPVVSVTDRTHDLVVHGCVNAKMIFVSPHKTN